MEEAHHVVAGLFGRDRESVGEIFGDGADRRLSRGAIPNEGRGFIQPMKAGVVKGNHCCPALYGARRRVRVLHREAVVDIHGPSAKCVFVRILCGWDRSRAVQPQGRVDLGAQHGFLAVANQTALHRPISANHEGGGKTLYGHAVAVAVCGIGMLVE